MDDIWEDCDDFEYEQHMSEKNLNRLNETNDKVGYLEGFETGKNKTLQSSFEEGFKKGINKGLLLGEAYGNACTTNEIINLINGKPNESLNRIMNIFNQNYKDVETSEFIKKEINQLDSINIEKNNNNENDTNNIENFINETKQTLNSI